VQAHQVDAFQAGERQIVGTVKNALIDSAQARGVSLRLEPETPDLLIDVRGGEQGLVVSLDISGRAMHLRGYRQVAGAAPLREDVAALLVMLMRHDSRKEPLFDPFAGAGTIGIEASLLAQGAPTWCAGRRPKGAAGTELDSLLREPLPALFGDTQPCVLLSDEDPEACSAAERNLQMASVTNLQPQCADFRSWNLGRVNEYCEAQGKPGPGVIVSNPPYGERLGDPRELVEMYRELGRWCRQFRGWRAGFLVANPDFEDAFGQRATSKKPLFNGPLRATFYQYEL
jgi:23S rRNA G2445 N2-methylase RlmL